MRKIALFGTSADPPTAGHLAILQWLSENYDLVAVWASDNPFKEHQTTLEHRLQMLRLLISELNKDNIAVYEQLSDRRSLFSVQKAKEIWGDEVEYSLVIGSDLVAQIRRWYQAEQLLQQVTVLIIPRTGYPISLEDLEKLSKLGGKYKLIALDGPDVSSTSYPQNKEKEVIPDKIKDYIKQEKLYHE